ncbi:hypothetical protein JCM8115_005719 [Rhodotorula mucilaginosa]|uniref:Uncharacterized protein n=1 Tax=Rhodotorula mucilaginosa TaxID=5537 RepID=A0A9P7B3A9_RHOMI|nr:hypothetical protein C6P46_006990 [Rhodotorula mucilaginosa]
MRADDSNDESSAKIHEKEASSTALPVEPAAPAGAEHEMTETAAQVEGPHDKVALSELSIDRSADSDCFETGTLLSSLNSAATSSDVGQTTEPSNAC